MDLTSTLLEANESCDALWGPDGHDGVDVADGPSAIEPVVAFVSLRCGVSVAAFGRSESVAIELLAANLRRLLAGTESSRVSAAA